jgi:hypothetical protein
MFLGLSLLYNLKQYSKTEKGAKKFHPLIKRFSSYKSKCTNTVRSCVHGFQGRRVACKARLREHNRVQPQKKPDASKTTKMLTSQQRFDKFDRQYAQQRKRLLRLLKVCTSEEACLDLTKQLKALEEENRNQEEMLLEGIMRRASEEDNSQTKVGDTFVAERIGKRKGLVGGGCGAGGDGNGEGGAAGVGTTIVATVPEDGVAAAEGGGEAARTEGGVINPPKKRRRKPDPIFDMLAEATIRKTDARVYAKALRDARYTSSTLSSLKKGDLLEQFQMKPLHVRKLLAFFKDEKNATMATTKRHATMAHTSPTKSGVVNGRGLSNQERGLPQGTPVALKSGGKSRPASPVKNAGPEEEEGGG